ncbi:MAG: ATP-binding protein [Treponema sp.]|nr:ATP-binding protein [Treponema sp.]
MKLTRIRERLLDFVINFATSGKYTGKSDFGMSDYLIRYVLLNFISVFGGGILVGFIVIRFNEGKYGTVAACGVMLLIAIMTIVFSRMKRVSQMVPALMLMIFYGMLCLAVTYLGEAEGTNFLFVYMYPLTTIMLLGMKIGIIFSAILVVLVSLQMYIPGLSLYNYDMTVPAHLLVTYALVFSVMVVVETTRKTKDRLIEIQNLRVQELREEAEMASRTKSSFLANMSHEIRTPMNAITGMTELLLRRDLPEDARGDIQDIKQAASNLISIINDILDFSKIEAGKLEIHPVRYMLSSLINDTVNIIRLRLIDKPIRFFTNIDGSIPNVLVGDEVRIRQILINLLSNAAKFTEKGHISMSVTTEKRNDRHIWLKISVTDTGQGIKEEDQIKLFGDFTQVDGTRNRTVEGTGLGLAITKRLCQAMEGDIRVESEYGKGSTFSILLPQFIDKETPFASVLEADQKKVLVYEGRQIYAHSVAWALDNMKVPHLVVHTESDFTEALQKEEWFFIFSGYGLYEKIKLIMEQVVFPSERRPRLALMVEWGIENFIPNVRFISLPVQSLSIANTLNGKSDRQDYFDTSISGGGIRFIIPRARILIVDDIAVNLKVAEGLMAPYKAKLDTCLSGQEAIELCKTHDYDLVFMDHMMPEMDGIETTERIRASVNLVPIIALTANAISGMREMFIEKGFNDFLPKPIDVSKLDDILDHWIPQDKKEFETINAAKKISNESPAKISIPGVDTEQGISMTGGNLQSYRSVLSMFCKDGVDRLPYFTKLPSSDNLTLFVTQVHALKSASASIGAESLSQKADDLERAGKQGDLSFIGEHIQDFYEDLAILCAQIKDALKLMQTEDEKHNNDPGDPEYLSLLQDLQGALQSQKTAAIDSLIDMITKKVTDKKALDLIEDISDDILLSEFPRAESKIKELLAELTQGAANGQN